MIRKNDFVINSRSDRRGSCGISEYDGSCSLINTVLKPRGNMNNKYYSFVFKSDNFADEFYRWGHGIVNDLWSTKWSDMKNIYIPSPTIDEQKRIADYLDKRCSRIDTIIEKQQEIIEKLKEYKLSVITEAVTKGLNLDVEMKDSGVEWIGEIPNHCCVTRAGHIYNIILGKMLSPNPKDESNTLESYYCAANVHFEGVDNSSLKQMWFSEGEKEQYLVKKDDLLVVEGGAAIVKEDDENVYVQNSIMIVRNDNPTLNRWLYYTLYSLVKREYIDLICNKATIPHFTKEKLGNVPVVLFSEDEIEEMVSYLSDKCNSIEKTIHDRENAIEKLKEYKKSLIYEVVTGKKEV